MKIRYNTNQRPIELFNFIRSCESSFEHIKIFDGIKCLYFIGDGQYVKIGVASDLDARINALQCGNARKLEWLAYAEMPSYMAFVIEKELHMNFEQYHVLREWYDIYWLFNNTARKQEVHYKKLVDSMAYKYSVETAKVRMKYSTQ